MNLENETGPFFFNQLKSYLIPMRFNSNWTDDKIKHKSIVMTYHISVLPLHKTVTTMFYLPRKAKIPPIYLTHFLRYLAIRIVCIADISVIGAHTFWSCR